MERGCTVNWIGWLVFALYWGAIVLGMREQYRQDSRDWFGSRFVEWMYQRRQLAKQLRLGRLIARLSRARGGAK